MGNMKILIVLGIFCRLACSQSYVPSYGAPQPHYQPRMYPVAVQPQYVPQYVNGGRSSYRSYEPYPQTYYARPTSSYQPASHYQPRYSRDEPTPSYQPASHYRPVTHYQPVSHYQPIRHYRSYEPTYYQPRATYQPATYQPVSHYQPNRQYRSHTPNLTYHVRASYRP